MGSDTPSTRVHRAIASVREARLDGRPDDALRRLTGAAAMIGSARVKRSLAVALCRERGLCHVHRRRGSAVEALPQRCHWGDERRLSFIWSFG